MVSLSHTRIHQVNFVLLYSSQSEDYCYSFNKYVLAGTSGKQYFPHKGKCILFAEVKMVSSTHHK